MPIDFRSLRYFSRATLRAAVEEARAAGIPKRHAAPLWKEISKRDRIVVVMSYPYLNTAHAPHVLCVVQWAEGGLQWQVDVLMDRFRSLPKIKIEDSDLYRFQ